MQGTIPLCSDIGILRYSSAPFAEFVYSEELTHNALSKMEVWNNYEAINFDIVAQDWFKKIDFLYSHNTYVELLYSNLRYVERMVKDRYDHHLTEFMKELLERIK